MSKNNEIEIVGNLQDIENAIYGETTKNYSEKEFNAFRKNAIKEIHKIVNHESYDENLINDLINYLNNVTIVSSRKQYLTYQELVEMENNNKITDAKSFYKAMLLGFITNIMEQGDYEYQLTESDIEQLAEDLSGNDNIYEALDSEMSYALMDYEKKVRRVK